MDNFNVYNDIKARTGGEIYIGVVGPVRTGKSTFIKRFMDLLVIPGMEDEYVRERTRDELPQSAAGKTIMTTEPKFIPKEAALVKVSEDIDANVRLIDCVGYMVEGATGHIENEVERLVKTPWFDYEIPFTQAAEIGTKKVIKDHSTIGFVVTADGSFSEIPRENYVPAEERTVKELKKIGKPFIILLNSEKPYSSETLQLARGMEEKYGVSAVPVNCQQLKREDINKIMEKVLKEFPVTEIDFFMPKWAEILPANHPIKEDLVQGMKQIVKKVSFIKEVSPEILQVDSPYIKNVKVDRINMSNGSIATSVDIDPVYYFQMLSDMTDTKIDSEYTLIKTIQDLSSKRNEYDKVNSAMEAVRMKGYGVVAPRRDEIKLAEPEVIKHGNKYGVKINAEAPSVHLIRANIQTEIAPIVGSEQQAEDLKSYIKENAAKSEEGIWTTNIFGKSIEQIVDDGIHSKINTIPEDSQVKLQDTLQKIMNDSNGGLICIII